MKRLNQATRLNMTISHYAKKKRKSWIGFWTLHHSFCTVLTSDKVSKVYFFSFKEADAEESSYLDLFRITVLKNGALKPCSEITVTTGIEAA